MKIRQLAGYTAVVCTIFLLSGIVFGQQKEFANISNQGTGVVWTISAPHEKAVLTVSGPGGVVYRQEFDAGTNPVFTPVTQGGAVSTDGGYNYEITLTPILRPEVKEQMRVARRNGTSDELLANLKKRGVIPPVMKHSGSFRVISGQIFTKNDADVETPGSEEPSAIGNRNSRPSDKKDTGILPDFPPPSPEDQQILDDLIVIGSACVGQDCVNGENFGFDTIRVKENNLRFHFDDTSNSGSFPSNDWRIVANDSSNGGASYLAFEDSSAGRIPFRVEAAAPANSLVVEADGDIGIGTLNPVVEFHMVDGDSPTMRLEQDGSSGFQAQTWDVAGNETNFFVRDVTNASKLPFKIRPGAPDNRIVIGPNGVGFSGDNTPNAVIDVVNGKLTVDANGNLVTAGSVEIDGTGLIFPDGSTQTTAAIGTGFGETNTASNLGTGEGVHATKVGVDLRFKSIKAGSNITVTSNSSEITIGSAVSSTGSGTAQHVLGGAGVRAAFSSIPAVIDFNSFGVGTGGAAGTLVTTNSIPYNLNLANSTATQIVVKIRYRDADGAAGAARVVVELVGIDINTGGRASNLVFDSNTEAATGFTTVTKCIAAPSALFSANTRGMHANITMIGTAALNADFAHMQIYKSNTCP